MNRVTHTGRRWLAIASLALLASRAVAQDPTSSLRAPLPPVPPSNIAGAQIPVGETLPPGDANLERLPGDFAPNGPLTLDEVRRSVDRAYPLLAAALAQRGIASGEHLSAHGAYDVSLDAWNETGALGFYRTNRAQTMATQPLWWGGKAYAGYRIGRGSFEPWYLERETNKGGEFKVGASQPLLQNLDTDKRRTGLQKTALARQAVEPDIDRQRIGFLLAASEKYWKWIAAGHNYQISRDLLNIAQMRAESIADAVKAGRTPEIEQVDNQRLIVSRQAKLIQAERKFLQAAVELSMYYRQIDSGETVVPPASRLAGFPEPGAPNETALENDLNLALDLRPELRYIRLQRQKTSVELNLARNQMLPSLDTGVFAAQDVGQQTPKGDKTPFQLEAGLYFDVPVQRRYALGQVRAFESQLAQISSQERYYADRIVADVRFAMSGLITAYNELQRAREGVSLAERMEQAERDKFAVGNSNILFVNLREQATADTRFLVIDALENYHLAEAEYRAALGIDTINAPRE